MPERLQVSPGLVRQVRDPLSRRLEPQQGDEIGLAQGRILAAGGLAHFFGRTFRIQKIIDDLIGQADIVGEADQGVLVLGRGLGDDQRNLDRKSVV